jgi:hypothetical protein
MSLQLTPTGIGVLDDSMQTEYWIGAAYWDVANTQISARTFTNISVWWIFNPETYQHGWTRVNGPYRGGRDVVLRRVMTPINLYTRALGQNNPRTLMSNGSSVTDFVISGDGLTYFCNDSGLGWMKFESGDWTALSIAPSMQLSASFSGSVVCGVDDGKIAYRSANASFDADWALKPKKAAVIGTTIVVGVEQQLYLVDSEAVATPVKQVDGKCVGVFSDASLVWVGTDTPSTYISADRGRTWVRIPDVRVVWPGLVVKNGAFSQAVFVPPDEPDPTPINPNPINPTNPNPPSKGLTALEKTLIGLGIALVIAIPLGYLLTRRTNKKRSN